MSDTQIQLPHLARHLWQELGDPEVPVQEVIDSLRTLGLINLDKPESVLELACLLRPQFLALKASLPFLSRVLAGFLLAERLNGIVICNPNLAHTDEDYLDEDYWRRLIENHQLYENNVPAARIRFDNRNRLDTPQFASACAVEWLARSASAYLPDISRPTSPERQGHSNPIHLILSNVDDWSKNKEQPQQPGNEIADLGFFAWQTYFSEALQKFRAKGKTHSSIFEVEEAARYLVDVNALLKKKKNGKAQKFAPDAEQPIVAKEEQSQINYQRDFSIRNLLTSHWNYPRPAELKSIKELLGVLAEKPTYGSAGTPAFECILIGLAICTGRSIAEVLNVSINGPAAVSGDRWATDFLQVEAVSVHSGDRSNKIPWVFRKIQGLGPSDWIRLPLPRVLSQCLLNSLLVVTATRLEDLLPLSAVPWEDRCYSILESNLSTSRKRSELLVRDFLARQLFAATTNAAVVRLLCDQTTTEDKKGDRRQLALSYYLDLRQGRLWDAYREACKPVISFGDLPISLQTAMQASPGTSGQVLNLAQFNAAVACLLGRLPSAVTDKTVVFDHNVFAQYTLFLLIAATGHRKSLTPFFFPWDICPEEKLAFVSDKQVTGSEARFVPLPQLAVDQYMAYRAHLVVLSSKLAALPAVAKHLKALLPAISGVNKPLTKFEQCADPEFSQFFYIDEHHQLHNFGTDFLDKIINKYSLVENQSSSNPRDIEKAVLRVSVRRFRNSLADYLWEASQSGSMVQAWLGHAPELHSFGEASTWSVQDWANEIRPHIQAYLTQRGLVYRPSPIVERSTPNLTEPSDPPSFLPSSASYEGRAINSKFASNRALKVLRQMLPEDLLEWQAGDRPGGEADTSRPLVIDDELQTRIAQELRSRLGGDRLALDKVTKTITEELKRLKKRGAHVTAASTNLFRSDPGPVSVSFARHLSIARAIRTVWLGRWVSEGLGRKEDLNRPPAERLTHLANLAISLVIFDANLDPVRVRGLTLAATSKKNLQFYSSSMTLRARITTARDIYDWSILPSAITTAQLLGLHREGAIPAAEKEITEKMETLGESTASAAEDALWKKVEDQIRRVLARMQMQKPVGNIASIAELCMVFRPWWHLRLPGAVYAIATGEHAGPAPSRISEQSLFAVNEPQALENRPSSSPRALSKDAAQKGVLICINKLFSDSDAGLSRTSRANLGKILKQPYQEELLFYVSERPIVQHALGFIEYLLDVGGPQQPTLRFSSIRTYYSKVIPLLVERWWDQSIADWSGADFDAAYKEIFNKGGGKRSAESPSDRIDALRQFHRYLRDTTEAPFSRFLFQNKSQPARRRSDVLTWRAIDHAVRDVRSDTSIPDAGRLQGETMIAMAAGYGLRHSEVIPLTTGSFFGKSMPPVGLAINRNRFGDVKSSAGRRVIAQPLMSSALKRIAAGAFKRAKAAEKTDVLSSRNARLINISTADTFWSYDQLGQRCISALRRASTSNATVLHTLRHTFATAIMLELFKQRPPSVPTGSDGKVGNIPHLFLHPACSTARERLLGMLNNNFLVEEMLQLPKNWPFAVDSLAQVLGHADVSTLLGCYFHGMPILLAELTHGHIRDADMVDDRLALILGIERSTVTKRRNRGSTKAALNGGSTPTPIERILSFDLIKGERQMKIVRVLPQSPLPAELENMPWEVMDNLLLQRRADQYSLEVLKERAIQMNVGANKAARFVASYRRIVEETGFDDFEFKGSELVDHTPKRRSGVSRSKEERQASLRMLQSRSFADRELRDNLRLIAKIWFERVDPQNPWLVLRQESEAKALEKMCKVLEINLRRGADTDSTTQTQPRSIRVHMSGTPSIGLLQYLNSIGIAAVPKLQRDRFSRSGGSAKASEVGVQFPQNVGFLIGDGRDTHRLFLVLAAALLLPEEN